MDTILENNQLITSNFNENSLEETCNNRIKSSVSTDSTIKTNLSEKTFDTILNNLKVEYNCDDSCSEFEDFEGITEKLTYNNDIKLDQQDKMCEVASSLNENQNNNKTDGDNSKSNLQEVLKTESFDSQITSMYRNSPSTSYPTMEISKKNSTPHICEKDCAWCSLTFLVLDYPHHIKKIRSIEKQNAFLKMQPSLKMESCICDLCWKFMEKTYKSIKPEKIKKNSKKYPKECHMNKFSPKKRSVRICSVHDCFKSYIHKMTVEQCKNLKELLLLFEYCKFVLVEPLIVESLNKKKNQDLINFPICLCYYHFLRIDFMSSCQLCGNNVNENFNTDDWLFYEDWNLTLINNNISLILQPGMFLCVTCKEHISKPDVFSALDLEKFRQYVNLRIGLRLKMYGPPQYNLFNMYQGYNMSTNQESPLVVFKMIKEEIVRYTKITFSYPLITVTYHFEHDSGEDQSKSLTSSDKQTIYFPKVEPTEENDVDQLCSFYTDSLNQSAFMKPEIFYRNSSQGLIGILKNTKYVDSGKSFQHYCELNNDENEMSRIKINKPKIISVYSFRRPRRDNNLDSRSKDLEKEVVDTVSIKRGNVYQKNAVKDGKKQRLIETQSSIENVSTPKSYQNKSQSSDVDG